MDTSKPTLIIATDTEAFDLTPWIQEGYNALHVPCASSRAIENATDDIEDNTKCALIAFGRSATNALALAMSSLPSLLAVIAYYPPSLPCTPRGFHPGVRVLIHLPSTTPFSTAADPPRLTVRIYADVGAGFAEEGLEGYDRIAAGLAYSRSLDLLRRTVGPDVDPEDVWSERVFHEFVEMDAEKTVSAMAAEPYVNNVPTCTGGVGYKDLLQFYKHHFIPKNPPTLKMKLVSRTVGSDRIVDELVLSFRHTTAMDWMLPGVPPTGKWVEVALVSIVCIKGGKLHQQHMYWDQASVLVQIGLLDRGSLPVMGAESARKVLDGRAIESNELIPNWPPGES